jgi:hypothetical protein
MRIQARIQLTSIDRLWVSLDFELSNDDSYPSWLIRNFMSILISCQFRWIVLQRFKLYRNLADSVGEVASFLRIEHHSWVKR